jgi:hypothetical protein
MQKIVKTMDAFFSLEELAKKRTSVHALHPAAKLIVYTGVHRLRCLFGSL